MANISHFTQTVNGVSTTYDIHDANAVDLTSNQTVAGNKEFTGTTTFNSQIKGTIDKSKDYYLNDNTLASANGSLGIVKYYPAASTADLDTEIFEHSLWASQKVSNSIPTALDSFYYIDQYFYGGRTSTSNRIQILRGYTKANLQMVRVYDNSTNSWSEWEKFADDSDVVHKSGGEVMTGNLLASSTADGIGFGCGWNRGGTIYTYGSAYSDTASWQGAVRLQPFKTNTNYKTMELQPSGTWTWDGTAVQITSDQRLKQQIAKIDDKLLDAWEDVELCQFKYNESVDQKGDNARLHTGYVVQQIQKACEEHGVDISQYGLFCHEEYPQETEEIEVEQKDGTKTKERKVIREANEHYSLRYTEALIVECKYLRRRIERLEARLARLENPEESQEKGADK